MRGWRLAAVLGIAAVAFFAVFLRISNSFPLDSDAANNVLQASDMLHGNLLLHGWILGDATYYASQLPLYVLTVAIFGLHAIVPHVVSAFVYVAVLAAALGIALTGSHGLSRWLRSAVVVAILAALLLTPAGISIGLEKPDHTGTAAITLACFLLIDRAVSRAWLAPTLFVILVLGQISDGIVLYVTVPAILAVSAYRALTAASLRTGDALAALTAVLSVPAAALIQSLLKRAAGYSAIPLRHYAAPLSLLPHNLALTARGLFTLFGVAKVPQSPLGPVISQSPLGRAISETPLGPVHPQFPLGYVGSVFGAICLLAAVAGFGRVIWRWRTASRAEQLLCVAIVVNVGAYVFTTIPVPSNTREMIMLVPAGAVLAARALVPARVVATARTRLALAAATAAALLPLAAEVSVPTATPAASQLAAWLEGHGLSYGLGGYWDASALSLVSGGRVQVAAVTPRHGGLGPKRWEMKQSWYDPARHDATFVIVDLIRTESDYIPAKAYRRTFGRPVATYKVAANLILVYHKNLLDFLNR